MLPPRHRNRPRPRPRKRRASLCKTDRTGRRRSAPDWRGAAFEVASFVGWQQAAPGNYLARYFAQRGVFNGHRIRTEPIDLQPVEPFPGAACCPPIKLATPKAAPLQLGASGGAVWVYRFADWSRLLRGRGRLRWS